MSNFKFEISKYLGTWYELIHYPSSFQRNDNYNTEATYTLMKCGNINVHNSTITQGMKFESYGTARQIDGLNLRVDFPIPEVDKLNKSGQFLQTQYQPDYNSPNYIIDNLWFNCKGCYMFAVVTNVNKNSLYVLSRTKNPSLSDYNKIMEYVIANYDRDRLVQTPHYS